MRITTNSFRTRAARRGGLLAAVAAVAVLLWLSLGGQARAVDPVTITSVSPSEGPGAGGTVVTINGTGFSTLARGTAVRFGTTTVTSTVTCVVSTRCTVTSPPGAGLADIRATVSGFTTAVTPADRFAYIPAVAKIGPSSGPEVGGTNVSVEGSGFASAGTVINFGPNPATNVVCSGLGKCSATSPAGAGVQDVTVTVAEKTSALVAADRFTYQAAARPLITAISPATGPSIGGTVVTITGSNFSVTTNATKVRFGTTFATATAAPNVLCTSTTSCRATAPAGAGVVDVFVAVGATAISGAGATTKYTYIPRPTITSAAPNIGASAGGYVVAITGTGFSAGVGNTTVRFGPMAATVVACTTTICQVVAPSGATDINGTSTVDVTATALGQTSAITPADQFTYAGPTVATVTGVSPARSLAGGGGTVTVTGLHFRSVLAPFTPPPVSFGTVPAAGVACSSDTTCTATIPAGIEGSTVDVTVSVVDGANPPTPSQASAADRFTYFAAINEPPFAPHTVFVFPQRDFVSTTGFDPGDAPYTVEVVRGGNRVGLAANLTPAFDAAANDWLMEVNHPGGACWGLPFTPDITAGDVVRVTGRSGISEQTPTVGITAGPASRNAPAGLTITVHGRAVDANGVRLPIGQVEHRFVVPDPKSRFSNGRRTIRAASGGADGTFVFDNGGTADTYTATYVLNAFDADLAMGSESRGVWLGRGTGTEGTIFEVGDQVVGGPFAPACAPLEPDTIAPTAPAGLAVNVSFDSAHLTWSAATDNRAVAGYRVFRDDSLVATLSPTALNYGDLHVTPVGFHTWTVDAFDGATPAPNRSPLSNAVTAETFASAAPDLAIAKSHAGDFQVGVQGVYTITVTNFGTADTAGLVTILDTLPAGLGFVSATATGPSCHDNPGHGNCNDLPHNPATCALDLDGRTVRCTTDGLVEPGAAGAIVVTITVNVRPAAYPSVTNTATVANMGDLTPANDSSSDPTIVLAPTPVAINQPPIAPAAIISFPGRDFISALGWIPGEFYTVEAYRGATRIGIKHGARADAGGIVEINHPGGACWDTVTPNLQPGDLIRVIDRNGVAHQIRTANVRAVHARSLGGGVVVVRGTAQDANGQPIPSSQLSQRIVASTADPFNLSGRRKVEAIAGAGGADGVLAYDAPGSINWTATYTGLDAHDEALAVSAETRIIYLGVDPLAGVDLTIFEDGDQTFKGPAAGFCSTPADTNPTPARPDLAITSSHGTIAVPDFTVGQPDDYTLSVRNVGGADFFGQAIVTDDLPAGLTFITATSTGTGANWSCSSFGQRVTCIRDGLAGSLPSGDSNTIVIKVNVSALAVGDVMNAAEVSGPFDEFPANNRSEDRAHIRPAGAGIGVDLSVTSTHTRVFTANATGFYHRVDTFGVYHLTVRNHGDAETIVAIPLVDTLPAGMTFISTSAGDWACAAGPANTVACTTNLVLLPGQSSSVDLTIRADATAVGARANLVDVSYPGDGNAPDNHAEDVTTVNPNPSEPPTSGVAMIAFPARDFISASGFQETDGPIIFKVIRNGALIATSEPVDLVDDPATVVYDGIADVNHPGGGCWVTNTPDIRAGDQVVAITSSGIGHQITVAYVAAAPAVDVGGGSVQVHGIAHDGAGHPLPIGQVENRLIASTADPFNFNGRRVLRTGDGTLAYDAPGAITWTATYTGLDAHDVALALASESRAVWLGRQPPALVEMTIYENGAGTVGGPQGLCTAPLLNPADLQVAIQGPVAPPVAGEQVTVIVQVVNAGPTAANPVRLLIALPVAASDGVVAAAQTFMLDLGPLAVGLPIHVPITFTMAAGAIDIVVLAAAPEADGTENCALAWLRVAP